MMMIGIGLVGYEESRPLKAAIGKLARCRDDGFAVTLARRRDIDRQRHAVFLNGNPYVRLHVSAEAKRQAALPSRRLPFVVGGSRRDRQGSVGLERQDVIQFAYVSCRRRQLLGVSPT